jgi:predicted MFS family arabinose efflux permease
MSWFESSGSRDRRFRRRSELALLGVIGVVGYLALTFLTSTGGELVIRVVLGLAVLILFGLIGLLCWRAREPEARRRLVGLVRHAQAKRLGDQDEGTRSE